MAQVNLNNDAVSFDDGYDSIIIVDNFQSKRGGAALDVEGFTRPYIRAGHVIIKETATGEFKPMPLNADGDGYGSLPGGHEYYGILINTIRTSKPAAGILLRGTVNPNIVDPAAGVFDISPILSAVQTALTDRVHFLGDND